MAKSKLPDALEWEAYEYLHYDRSADWFWGVGLITLVIAIAAIILQNVLLAVLVGVGAVTITLRALRHPEIKRFALTPRGAIENNTLYPYSTLDSFWVDDESLHPKLLIKSKQTMVPLIIFPLPESVNPQIIHDYLIQYLYDEPMEESSLQRLLEIFGF
jgi:hypothetical protein